TSLFLRRQNKSLFKKEVSLDGSAPETKSYPDQKLILINRVQLYKNTRLICQLFPQAINNNFSTEKGHAACISFPRIYPHDQ
ncbi:MAG: hypothetical protein P8P89_08100, partial [Paracoccaceae bacterium]|nr:hypothetical protein [Paracoccaceae bacterium]